MSESGESNVIPFPQHNRVESIKDIFNHKLKGVLETDPSEPEYLFFKGGEQAHQIKLIPTAKESQLEIFVAKEARRRIKEIHRIAATTEMYQVLHASNNGDMSTFIEYYEKNNKDEISFGKEMSAWPFVDNLTRKDIAKIKREMFDQLDLEKLFLNTYGKWDKKTLVDEDDSKLDDFTLTKKLKEIKTVTERLYQHNISPYNNEQFALLGAVLFNGASNIYNIHQEAKRIRNYPANQW